MQGSQQQTNMSSLLELLSQNQPQFDTNQALAILCMQNDFTSNDGKLPVTTGSCGTKFLDHIRELVPTFRNAAGGNVIWTRTQYEGDRLVNDPNALDGASDAVVLVGAEAALDEDHDLPAAAAAENTSDVEPATRELFAAATASGSSSKQSRSSQRAVDALKRFSARKKSSASLSSHAKSKSGSSAGQSSKLPNKPQQPLNDEELFLTRVADREPCCVPNTRGVAFNDLVESLREPSDAVVTTSHYSAFRSTDLLLTLRARLVTELFICGCVSNINVYATAMDAARHGISIIIVDDCLGFRNASRHQRALGTLRDVMGASIVSSVELIRDMESPEEDEEEASEQGEGKRDGSGQVVRSSSGTPASLEPDDTEEEVSTKSKRGLKKTKVRMRTKKDTSDTKSNNKPDDVSAGKGKEKATQTADATSPAAGSKPARDAAAGHREPRSPSRPRRASSSHSSKTPTNSPPTQLKTASPTPEISASAVVKEETTMQPSSNRAQSPASAKKGSKVQSLATLPTLGPGDAVAEGDTHIHHSLMPQQDAADIFQRLYTEVRFMSMSHVTGNVPRLVAVQGDVYLNSSSSVSGFDASIPVYRHPTDHAPLLMRFSPAVDAVRRAAQAAAGGETKFNHALIQLYRGGTDFISEHADKTLDIASGSSIANASFGARRTMRLRTKRVAAAETTTENPSLRETQRVPMPHNSLLVLGPHTNARWLHAIQPDKRNETLRASEENAYSGWRISITFRQVDTYMSIDSKLIWGQGARCRTRAETETADSGTVKRKTVLKKGQIICGGDSDTAAEERTALVQAFGLENREGIAPPTPASSKADLGKSAVSQKDTAPNSSSSPLPTWTEVYKDGYDILHFQTPPLSDQLVTNSSTHAILFEGDNEIANAQVRAMLQLRGLESHPVPVSCPPLRQALAVQAGGEDGGILYRQRDPLLRDTDEARTEIEGVLPILLYLNERYPGDHAKSTALPPSSTATKVGKVATVRSPSPTNVRDLNKQSADSYAELVHAIEIEKAFKQAVGDNLTCHSNIDASTNSSDATKKPPKTDSRGSDGSQSTKPPTPPPSRQQGERSDQKGQKQPLKSVTRKAASPTPPTSSTSSFASAKDTSNSTLPSSPPENQQQQKQSGTSSSKRRNPSSTSSSSPSTGPGKQLDKQSSYTTFTPEQTYLSTLLRDLNARAHLQNGCWLAGHNRTLPGVADCAVLPVVERILERWPAAGAGAGDNTKMEQTSEESTIWRGCDWVVEWARRARGALAELEK